MGTTSSVGEFRPSVRALDDPATALTRRSAPPGAPLF